MDLLKNPFHLLSASPRDSRRRITELAEERALFTDAEECAEARAVLTNPLKRLRAEVSWLPGVSSGLTGELLRKLDSEPESLLEESSLPPLARTNLLAAALERLKNPGAEELSRWLRILGRTYEAVDAAEVLSALNADRRAAGFPEVSEQSLVEESLKACRGQYRSSMKAALDRLPSRELVRAVTLAAEEDSDVGQKEISTLIADLVDAYEVEAQTFLDQESETIEHLIKDIEEGFAGKIPDAALKEMTDILCQVVRNWDLVAQPVQVCARSRGLMHEASRELAHKLRDLAVRSWNDWDNLEISRQINDMIHGVFLEVDTVAELAEKDGRELEQIRSSREHSQEWSEKFRKEVTYETLIGFSRKKFRISPEGIEWDGRFWKQDSITRIRWGGRRVSLFRTSYTVFFGTAQESASIVTGEQDVFLAIANRLWKSAGIALLVKFVHELGRGRKFRFGNAVVSDTGIGLWPSFSSQPSDLFFPWRLLTPRNAEGMLHMDFVKGLKPLVSLSYLDEDNVQVLDTAIRLAREKKCARLSEIFD